MKEYFKFNKLLLKRRWSFLRSENRKSIEDGRETDIIHNSAWKT